MFSNTCVMIPYTWGDKVAMFSRTRGRGCALGTGAVRHVLGHQVGQDGAAGGTVGDAHVGRLEQVLLVQARLHLVHMLGVEGGHGIQTLQLDVLHGHLRGHDTTYVQRSTSQNRDENRRRDSRRAMRRAVSTGRAAWEAGYARGPKWVNCGGWWHGPHGEPPRVKRHVNLSRRCWGWRNASRGNACGPGVGKRLGRRARGRLTWLQTLLHERHAMQRAAGCEANTRDRYIYKDDAIYIVYPRQPHKWSYTATAKRLRNVRRGAHPHKHGACRYCADTIHCTQASDSHRPRPAVDIYTLPFRRHPRAKQGEQTMLV